MKSFIKKINRGVILSLLIILGIASYYAALAIRNAPHKKEMDTLLTDFYNQYEQIFLVPEQYCTGITTEDQVKPLYSDIKSKLRPFFASQEDLDAFFTQHVEHDIFAQTVRPGFRVNSHDCEFVDIKAVKIDFKKDTATVHGIFRHGSSTTTYDLVFEQGREVWTNPREDTYGPYIIECSFTLAKVDGEWKITAMQSYHGF